MFSTLKEHKLTKVETIFAQTFENWGITLPVDAVSTKEPGQIHKAGWSIRYVFSEDYMDYYATHRMTNDRHVRIHVDGSSESLESPRDFVVYPKDADEGARTKADEEFYAYNQAVYAKLRAKGFVE